MHPAVTTADLQDIDWAAVAERARADLGEERVARFSEHLRTTMTVIASRNRPSGDGWGHRTGELRTGASHVTVGATPDRGG